jgi:hypothetical protein
MIDPKAQQRVPPFLVKLLGVVMIVGLAAMVLAGADSLDVDWMVWLAIAWASVAIAVVNLYGRFTVARLLGVTAFIAFLFGMFAIVLR